MTLPSRAIGGDRLIPEKLASVPAFPAATLHGRRTEGEMSPRTAVPRLIRFEVFKRDKFACQYCGAKAPGVVLQMDHIHPVAEGGTNEIMNLVTACVSCNGGKGARLLDDQSVVERQRQQIEELEERRQQLEMMLKWRDEATKLDSRVHEAIADHVRSFSEYGPNENGMKDIRQWARSYPLDIILSAIDECFERYLIHERNGQISVKSWNEAFKKVPAYCRSKQRYGDGPEAAAIAYTQGIMRRRHNDKHYNCMSLLKRGVDSGISVYELQVMAKESESIAAFEDDVLRMVSDNQRENSQ